VVLDEIIERSPVRIFEKAIRGGLKAGELGIIASPTGLGKTSVLVQIALDKLLQGKRVIHVSFTQHTDYVLSWYADIFNEFIQRKNLENPAEVKDDLVRNRVLMNFNQDVITDIQILHSLRAMILDGGFKADAVIVDGFDFSRMDAGRLSAVKDFGREMDLSIWYSCNIRSQDGPPRDGIPAILAGIADQVEAVITLEPRADYIALTVAKARETYNPDQASLKLDPKTLLILEAHQPTSGF
jgi:hypothetical protein